MSRSLGSLTLDLVLKTGGFKQSFDAAAREAASGGKQISAAMQNAGERLAASLLTPLEKLRASVKLYGQLLTANAGFQETYNRAIRQSVKDFNAVNPAMQRWNEMVTKGAQLTSAAITPLERYRQKFKEITQLALSGQITPAVRKVALDDAKDELNRDDPEIQASIQRKNALLAERDDILRKNSTAQEDYNRALERANVLEKAGLLVGDNYNREIKAITAALNAADPAMEEQARNLEQAKRLASAASSPLDDYLRRVRELARLKVAAPQIITDDVQKTLLKQYKADYDALNPTIQENNRLEAEAARIRTANLTPLERHNEEIAQATELLKKKKLTDAEANREIARSGAAYRATDPAIVAHNKLLADGKALALSMQNPYERYVARLRELRTMLKSTAIDQETFNRAQRAARRERDAANGPTLVGRALGTVGSRVAAAAGAYASLQSIKSIIQIADEYARLENRLSLVTKSTSELATVQENLFGVAQRTRTEYTAVADLYAKLALTGNDLGVSQQNIIKFTEAVGNALAISGTSAQTARGALNQLAQGLAAGVFRAEEFNSVLEGSPELIRVVARNIDRFKGNVGLLRKEVADSKLQSREFFDALLKGSEDLKRRVSSLPLTPGQAFTQLQNTFQRAVSQADLSPIVDAITDINEQISDPQFQKDLIAFVDAIITLAGIGGAVAGSLGRFFQAVGENFQYVTGQLSEMEKTEIKISRIQRDLAETNWLDKDIGFLLITNDQLREQLRLLQERRKELLNRSAPLGSEARTKAISREPAIAPISLDGPPIDDKKAQREAESARDAILNQVNALNQQRAVLGLNAVETIKYRIAQGDLSEQFKKAGPAFNKYKDALIQGTAALEQATAQEKLSQIVEGIDGQIKAFEREKIAQEQGAAAAAKWDAQHGELAKTIRASAGVFEAANGAAVQYSNSLQTLAKPVDVDIDVRKAQAAISSIVNGMETITVVASRRVGDGITESIEDQDQAFRDAAKSVEAYAKTLDNLSLRDLKTKFTDPAGFPIDVTRPLTEDLETEFTITVGIDDRFYNLPTIINGIKLDAEKDIQKIVDDAMRRVAEGESIPNFSTEEEAKAQAPLRSQAIEQARLQAAADIEAARGVDTLTEATRRYNEALAILKDIRSSPEQKEAAYVVIKETEATLDAAKAVRGMVTSILEQRQAREALRIAEEQGVAAAIDYRIAHGDLKELFRELGTSGAAYRDQLIAISEAEAKLAHEQEAIEASEQIFGSASKAAKQWALQIEGLTIRLGRGDLTMQQFNKAVRDADKAFREAAGGKKELDVFLDEAKRNTQDVLADFLKDPFEDGLKGLVQKFDEAFREIAANAVAAKLADKLFNGVDGWLDKLFIKLQDMFSGDWADNLPNWIQSLFGREQGAGLEDIAVTAQHIMPGERGGIPDPSILGAGVLGAGGGALAPALSTFGPAATALSSTLAAATAPMAGLTPALTAFAAPGTALTPALTAFTPAATALVPALTAFVPAATALATAMSANSLTSGLSLSDIPLGDILPLATGGVVYGPGTGTSDSILARLSNNEFVMPAAIVQKPGILQLLERMRSGLLPPAFAEGGLVMPKFASGGSVAMYSGANSALSDFVGGKNITVTQQFAIEAPKGSVSRQTQSQIAAAAARGLRYADGRNN